MADLDKGRVLRYQAEIKEARNFLLTLISQNMEETVRDETKVKSLKYTFVILAEAISNLCRHVLAKMAFAAVEEYVESIVKMQEKGFLSVDTGNRLIPLMKLRHQLIHGYWKIDTKGCFEKQRRAWMRSTLFYQRSVRSFRATILHIGFFWNRTDEPRPLPGG